jgi:hypothetical protein
VVREPETTEKKKIQICAQLLEVTGQEKSGRPWHACMASARAEQKCPRKICARVKRQDREKWKASACTTNKTKKICARAGPAVLLSGSKQKKQKKTARATGEVTGRRWNDRSGQRCLYAKKRALRAPQGKWPDRGASACKKKSPAESDQKATASKKKEKNSILRAPQGKWLHRGKVARLTRKQTKKVARPAEWMTGQKNNKKNLLARWQGSGEATGHKKNAARQRKIKNLHEEATGQEKVLRDKKEKGVARQEKGQVTDLRSVKKVLRDWKNCRWQTCADRPVRDRFNRSTMPVQPVLTRMVLVKTG